MPFNSWQWSFFIRTRFLHPRPGRTLSGGSHLLLSSPWCSGDFLAFWCDGKSPVHLTPFPPPTWDQLLLPGPRFLLVWNVRADQGLKEMIPIKLLVWCLRQSKCSSKATAISRTKIDSSELLFPACHTFWHLLSVPPDGLGWSPSEGRFRLTRGGMHIGALSGRGTRQPREHTSPLERSQGKPAEERSH